MAAAKPLFSYYKDELVYGPIDLPNQKCCPLFDELRRTVWENYQVDVKINNRAPWGNLGRVTVHEALPVCFG